jgi:hypothetical protein
VSIERAMERVVYYTNMGVATLMTIQKTNKEKPHDPQGTSGKKL